MARSPEQDKEKTGGPGTPGEAKKKRAVRAAGISSDLSFDEQVEIIGQINRVVAKNKIQITDDTFNFSARKRGVLIPLLINLGALVMLMTAGFYLIRYFDRQEASLVTESAGFLTAEAKLIAAVKQESEARLSEKDREIATIRGRLEELDAERRRLQLESETQVREREALLQADLERLLEEERGKLMNEGADEAAIQQQLSDLEARLREENRVEIADLRQQSEQELAMRDAELAGLQEQLLQREAELESRLREETGRLEAERSSIEAQLALLRENRQQEALVLEQLSAAWALVESEMQAGRTDTAFSALDSLENFLATPAFADMPAFRQRLPRDRFAIASLRELVAARAALSLAEEGESEGADAATLLAQVSATVAEADRASSAGDLEAARSLYQEALAAVPDLERSHEALLAAPAAAAAAAASEAERRLSAARTEIRRLTAELSRTRAAAAERRALSERLAAVRRGYVASAADAVSGRVTQEQVLALVETKLRVREAMTSEPMKSSHPDLYPELEAYLDAFAADQRARAQDEALQDVIRVLEGLAARRETLPALQGGYSTPQGDLFAELLDTLTALLQ